MVRLTLFDDQYQQAVADMIVQFQAHLKDAATEEERREIELAIQSWTAAHAEPKPSAQRACTPLHKCSNPRKRR